MENYIALIKDLDIYRGNDIVLKSVSLKIQRGDIIFILGKTGTGKTSLLKTLHGELPVFNGNCMVAGFNMNTMKWRELPLLRRNIGVIFQDFQLLNDRTVFENLEFVLQVTGWTDKLKINEKVMSVLAKVGMEAKYNKMPYQLSAGEQNKVDLARAILNNPSLILADEPTGNLDPESSDNIMNLLVQIAKENNSAVVVATHDMMIVNNFPGKTL